MVAHFHFVMVGGMVLAYFAALHFWWPKMTGRMYSDCWSRVAASIIIVGFFLTFMPQFILGYHGMPRRYPNYPPEFQFLNMMSTAGASILGLGLPDAGGLPDAVAVLRREGDGQPVERDRAGVADAQPADRCTTSTTTPVVVCGPYEYAIGVDQMGRGLPEPPGPGGAEGPSGTGRPTGPAGPMTEGDRSCRLAPTHRC